MQIPKEQIGRSMFLPDGRNVAAEFCHSLNAEQLQAIAVNTSIVTMLGTVQRIRNQRAALPPNSKISARNAKRKDNGLVIYGELQRANIVAV